MAASESQEPARALGYGALVVASLIAGLRVTPRPGHNTAAGPSLPPRWPLRTMTALGLVTALMVAHALGLVDVNSAARTALHEAIGPRSLFFLLFSQPAELLVWGCAGGWAYVLTRGPRRARVDAVALQLDGQRTEWSDVRTVEPTGGSFALGLGDGRPIQLPRWPALESAVRAQLADRWPAPPPSGGLPLPLLYAVFVGSGFAALVYQVVWQRLLFSIYGVDIESVTIVVTAFMVGLGLGSFAGGAISDRPGRRLLVWFGAIELGIGAYGAASLSLFEWVGAATAGAGGLATFGLSFGLVLVPTALMGSTLPLLVAHVVRQDRNVGRSVGVLYFVNTAGSAAAAIATAVWALGSLGLAGTVWFAASLNALVGLTILLPGLRLARRAHP